jgi:hypothetical protein
MERRTPRPAAQNSKNRKVRNRKMCKTQNQESSGFSPIPPMLIPSELPNWLLLRLLEVENRPSLKTLTNLYL